MLYIIFITSQCNLKCAYCGGSISEDIMPSRIKYDINTFLNFVERDKNKVIAFYGGEPTLFPDTIEMFIRSVKDAKFVMQTNGLKLADINSNIYRRLDSILVSIDGRKEITDKFRGRGTYERVLNSVRVLRKYYEGELIARMVVTESSDIFKEVMHIIKLGIFDYVHWQLDVVWSDRWTDFDGWLENLYYPGLEMLSKKWTESLLSDKKILGIVPFLGIIKRIIFGGSGLHCGAGESAISISTDGKIFACPVCGEFEWNILGDIYTSKLHEVLFRDLLPYDCKCCSVYYICGGRCLFAARERLWGEEKHRKICESVKYLIEIVENRLLDAVYESVNRGIFSLEDFYYPRFNNTCEVIP